MAWHIDILKINYAGTAAVLAACTFAENILKH